MMKRLAIAALMGGILLVLPQRGEAHSGHEHGPSAEVVTTAAPRFEALSDDFELLAVLKDKDLVIYLDRFRTNEAVPDARIEATANGQAILVDRASDGTYRIKGPLLHQAGRIEFVFTIAAGEVTDLLGGALVVPGDAVATPTNRSWSGLFESYGAQLISAASGVIAGALMVLMFRAGGRQRSHAAKQPAPSANATEPSDATQATRSQADAKSRNAGVIAVMMMALGAAMAPDPVLAEAPASKQAITITADLPQRLADGTLFVPKETQRLLTIRTVLAGESNAARTLQLTGQRVAKGQLLAVLSPIVPTADRSSYESTFGEIETRIALAEQKLARISRIPGAVPQKDIDDTRAELESLIRRRTAVRATIRERQELSAPITGVISMSIAVPGQLATAREVIFEIIDPDKLWVEAIAYDARIANEIEEARAITNTGERFPLKFIGRGLALRQQGTPLNFSIEKPTDTLGIGRPVTVVIQTRTQRGGMILPQAAVVKGANGLAIVWTHIGAERFKPNVVKVQLLDGERVLIEGGLAPNERVVIEGATILSQIR